MVVDTYTTLHRIRTARDRNLDSDWRTGRSIHERGAYACSEKRIDLKTRNLVRESMNVSSLKGLVGLVKSILFTTLIFESVGAVSEFLRVYQSYPLGRAVWMSIFHAVATFNNAGFDIIGGFVNLIPYQNNVLMNLSTAGLILCGSIGFLVLRDIKVNHSFKKLRLHSQVVISMTLALTVFGALLLKLTQPGITWMGAFFQSITRTAGFATYDFSTFTQGAVGSVPSDVCGGIARFYRRRYQDKHSLCFDPCD